MSLIIEQYCIIKWGNIKSSYTSSRITNILRLTFPSKLYWYCFTNIIKGTYSNSISNTFTNGCCKYRSNHIWQRHETAIEELYLQPGQSVKLLYKVECVRHEKDACHYVTKPIKQVVEHGGQPRTHLDLDADKPNQVAQLKYRIQC